MATDLPAGNGSEVLEETLGRLSKKAGVKATILLDRSSGAILKMEGQITMIRTAVGRTRNGVTESPASPALGGSFAGDASNNNLSIDVDELDETQGARELAGLVWNFVKTSGDLVEAIDTEDELKLLRLRTKKQELVIVPDSKYLLIVVHDTPPA
ncbi:hypothetical protein CMQ_5724 [Grosmannia clavigera kw1407]|uniref:Roadblock/LAMTOR2 domain-containing protein n=1 Tax=Grosmannia clavigera (strain kw1407 / UAMH 11150) TaxID=655863 RepID=F0XTB4_GROCL|nr:uncharacterized protein CMQ_5724 [Grosmannia clavigera kw1407]EFW99303.1 hypothetical protein CMQ_5724 [Grosmannia clavigera kw1407]